MKLRSSLALLLHLAAGALAADTNAWKSRTIYFALTDRIARNNNDNGGGSCDEPGGYHGYWAQDLNNLNAHYGSPTDLKNLVNAAHSKGIYVMVDVVANHMGPNIGDHQPSPLNQQSSYHPQCDINYNDQNSIENCWIANLLPDLRTTDLGIRDLFRKWIASLMSSYGFDGVRIDTVKHVEKDYWPGFVDAAGAYCIGEVFEGDPQYVSQYAKVMPGLLNYPMYYPMNRFYMQQGSSSDVVSMHDQITSLFPDPGALGTFVDNHDNPRWLNQHNDVSAFKNALAYVILARGIPIVYYGSEQAYSGGNDPQNREDLWRSGFNTGSDMYKSISRLISAKKSAGGLAQDDHVHLYAADKVYAWSRAGGKLIVVTTNAGRGSSAQYCFDSKKPNGSWRNTFGDGATYKADGSGKLCVNVSNGEPVVLLSS
ncbi:Alpha-amylase A type-1/2 [Cladobotryum mycophilum]|uniref:Alpha-amylase n=1 Tax=Cladobotryum mycophilum TaxID=491253 RepID=A0ABR0T514_9HYPO